MRTAQIEPDLRLEVEASLRSITYIPAKIMPEGNNMLIKVAEHSFGSL